MGNSTNYDSIRQRKIAERNRRLEQYRVTFQNIINKTGLAQPLIQDIIRADVVELAKLLNTKKVTSEQLVAIYGLRAATIGKELCIITEENFQFGLKMARQCDQERLKTGRTNLAIGEEWNPDKHLPALFGVPISIKDNIEMKSTSATVGLSCRANIIHEEDSPHIVCIKNSGMIPFIKTNLPQLAFNFDSSNFLWGRVLNPWNHNKSAGGSSGGEAAAVASGISPIGVGNDMGGSIRIPAHLCGVSGLMPSPRRMPQMGAFTKYGTAFSGKNLITPMNGPLGRSIDSLALWMSILTTESFYKGKTDPYVKFDPFDMKAYSAFQDKNKKLRIGYFTSLEMIECTPACSRAVMQTVEFLKREGNELVEIILPNQTELICTMFNEMTGEGNFRAFTDMLEGEQLAPEYKLTATITQLNSCLFSLASCFMKATQPRMGKLVEASRKLSTYEYQCMIGRAKELRQEWVDYWRSNRLDLVICPGFATEAPNHGASNNASVMAAYTFIWNLLGVPVATTPVTTTRTDEQRYESAYDDDITRAIRRWAADSAGLPVGVQIVGLPFADQMVLGLAKRIENNFKFYQNHPLPVAQKLK